MVRISHKFSFCAAEKFRFSAEFIEMRRQALDIFVNQIASHHELQKSEDLRTFLQVEEEVMFKDFLCRTVHPLFLFSVHHTMLYCPSSYVRRSIKLIHVLSYEQTMERLRSHDSGIFKKKPADLMQMFKVRKCWGGGMIHNS